jgi:fused signal recognition particle receptor
MAEARLPSFFKRLFGADELVERAEPERPNLVPGDRDEAKALPEDISVNASGAPDADAHYPSAAPAFADAEAGLAGAPEGRIEPLVSRTPPAAPAPPAAPKSLEQLRTDAVITPPPTIPAPAAPETPRLNWWERLRTGLSRSSEQLSEGIAGVFTKRRLAAATVDDLEDVLVQADLGVATAARIADTIWQERLDRNIGPDEIRGVLAREVEKVLAPVARPLSIDAAQKPFVILMVGVNGTGKTTTLGKLAARFRAEGRTVLLAAGDTFRAAAIEQLKIWGERARVPVIARPPGSDAAGLAFDAMVEAQKAGTDVLMIDTAGRLQNKAELMAELAKVVRIIRRHDPAAPHAVLLTLDATTGQNALNQVEVFRDQAGVTGLVMTKLDGTARGGILVAIAAKTGLPVHFIGVGEAIDDLSPFAARDFARAIAGLE